MSTALITGASSGIGEAFAIELAKRKNDLVLLARSEKKLQEIAQQLQHKYQIRAEVIAQDLTETDAGTKVFKAVQDKNLQIDLLINNAGFGDYGRFSETDREKQLDIVKLNVLALVDLTHQFLPLMQQRGEGSIINVSSFAAFQPIPYLSVYGATKVFILHFSEALWAENLDTGVKIIAFCPGPTETNFFSRAGFGKFASGGEKEGAAASPESVVKEALLALENNNSYVVAGGIQNKIISRLSGILPRPLLVRLVARQFRPK
ncbi:MAG: SDR family oxidoreductase [Oscillatoria sp. PMC 1051.18]|nr:SDR family oxidoreductase [Oscillatoria sp. PMC 1050.18]MEC5032153.1 SDR family oxidoreductase [Oscillatoria sp. PMC 1051.18]